MPPHVHLPRPDACTVPVHTDQKGERQLSSRKAVQPVDIDPRYRAVHHMCIAAERDEVLSAQRGGSLMMDAFETKRGASKANNLVEWRPGPEIALATNPRLRHHGGPLIVLRYILEMQFDGVSHAEGYKLSSHPAHACQ